MNLYIDTTMIKSHLNIDEDYCDEDEYLLSLADVAVTAVERHIMQPIDDILVDGELPADVRHACLLLIGNFWRNRESVAFAMSYKIPHSYEYLLNSYINYGSGKVQ